MATLINGNLNDPVYAAQDADLIAAICGNKTCIAPVGGEYAPTLEDANTIMVEDGVIITQEGRRIQLDAGDIDEFLIPTGSQGVTQYYICGYRLYTDEISAELCETFVEPVDSSSETITEGTFRSGETEVYVSLLRVKQEGVNITEITELLSKSTDINQINNDLNEIQKLITIKQVTITTDASGWATLGVISQDFLPIQCFYSGGATTTCTLGSIGIGSDTWVGVYVKDDSGAPIQGTLQLSVVYIKNR